MILFLVSLTLCLWFGIPQVQRQPGSIAFAQMPNPHQLVQQGVEQYQHGEFQAAIGTWQTALTQALNMQDLTNAAIVLENLARVRQQLGQTEQAIGHWQQAVLVYRQLGDRLQMGRMLTEQAQALSRQGLHRQAILLLCGPIGAACQPDSAIEIARAMQDQQGEAAALGSLGETYRLRGNYQQAVFWLQQSQTLAQALQNPAYEIAALNSLGQTQVGLALVNYRRADSANQRGDHRAATEQQQAGLASDRLAIQSFQSGLTLAQQQQDPVNQMHLLLGAIAPYYRTGQTKTAIDQTQQAVALLPALLDSQEKVYAAIDLTHVLQPIPPVLGAAQPALEMQRQVRTRTSCLSSEVASKAEQLLQQAISVAQRINDSRAASFAIGELGRLYECQGDDVEALKSTQQARWMAEQDLRAKDSLYLWEWQTGRILNRQGHASEAIAIYEQAVSTLETIRGDLLTANRDLQFDFRDTVDSLYRELVALRLERDQLQTTDRDKNLTAALKTLDSLKLSELQNYFGNDCIVVAAGPQTVDQVGVGHRTAIFNSVILADRTAIVASFPDGSKQINWIEVDRETLTHHINEYRRELERFYKPFDSQYAEQMYDWIIAPVAEALQQAGVKTLVFVQDGILRSVPMTALYDRQNQQFLVEQYAIATTPSLTLTETHPLERRNLKALAIGLSQGVTLENRQFPPLDNVNSEIQAIETELPGSKPLLNQNFTRDRLQQELDRNAYPILHIATHGEFGAEPEDTFLVTGDAQKMTINDLDQIFRSTKAVNQVDLLTLTACQTAAGDDRSALGLAGVAIQAGAKSALASLWFIDDATTAKIAAQFYANLRNNLQMSKAEALQAAQIDVIQSAGTTAHPAYWAPFILIGDWL